jgi:Flp pilus assembly protein TadD
MDVECSVLFFNGISCMEAGDTVGAEACFREAVNADPDFAEAYTNLALLLEKKGDKQGAEEGYRRAIAINPLQPETHLNFGVLLASQKRYIEAESAYLQCIELKPHSREAWSNLGVLYACMRREVDAERCYRTALFLDDSYAMASFNLSYLLLRQGRFDEGWSRLEARNWCAPQVAGLSMPRWRGESLEGKSILIVYEAGFGDVIQFCRYVTLLKSQGASFITLLCHPPLKTLLKSLEGVDEVAGFDDFISTSGWDVWTPLVSIAHYCKTRLDTIPAKIPYLYASPELTTKLSSAIPERQSMRVGLVWRGNPLFENDADRSLPSLDILAPLGAVSGVTFVSLQKGAGENDAVPDGLVLIQPSLPIVDFADTAALVSNLDLVISVDTAVAHLAGALGIPCWVLLPEHKTDWRWLNERTDTPWYPGVMRLFRQTRAGGWSDVISEVVRSLEEFKDFNPKISQ